MLCTFLAAAVVKRFAPAAPAPLTVMAWPTSSVADVLSVSMLEPVCMLPVFFDPEQEPPLLARQVAVGVEGVEIVGETPAARTRIV